jgi:hypothetical protein
MSCGLLGREMAPDDDRLPGAGVQDSMAFVEHKHRADLEVAVEEGQKLLPGGRHSAAMGGYFF